MPKNSTTPTATGTTLGTLAAATPGRTRRAPATAPTPSPATENDGDDSVEAELVEPTGEEGALAEGGPELGEDGADGAAFLPPLGGGDGFEPAAAGPDVLDVSEAGELRPSGRGGTSLVRSDPLTVYMHEIRRYPLLSREEEHELAVRFAQTQAPELGRRLITANLRLVVKIAHEYRRAYRNLLGSAESAAMKDALTLTQHLLFLQEAELVIQTRREFYPLSLGWRF